MKIKITGFKKTKEDFLSKLSNISNNIPNLKEKLDQLNIFSSLIENKKTLVVKESKNKISINSRGKDKNELKINFPNILGKGENLNISLRSLLVFDFQLSKPFIFNNYLLFADFTTKRSIEKLFEKEYFKNKKELGIKSKYLNFGIGFDKYIFIKSNYPILNFNIEQGFDFLKMFFSFNLKYNLLKNIQHEIFLNTGSSIGKINDNEKFYLGENIKGYKNSSIITSNTKKEGGRSFVEFTNKLLFNFKMFDFYFFNSLACTHKSNNIFNYKYKDNVPNSLGHTIGLGLSVPLYKKIDQTKIDISVGFPLIKEGRTDSYQFSFDIIF